VLKRTLGVPLFQEQVMQIAIMAAGFSAEKADALRRAMAAWKHTGNLESFKQDLVDGLTAKNYSLEFANKLCKQMEGFSSYGFPESHSVSFAVLAYVSSWIKCHEPAIFLAALLNSQPMGFYQPSQLVQDARRHGVEVRPVDVLASDWECALENGADEKPAVRLGFCMAGGFPEKAGQRLLAARKLQSFASVDDLAERANLDKKELKLLAAASALASLSGHRHNAHWQVAGVEKMSPLLKTAAIIEAAPRLPAPTEGENLVADYSSLGLTLGRHPLALLRGRLKRLRLSTAMELNKFPHGRLARAAGIVTGRQRPDTKSGVVFVTLEDETGNVNVVVWKDLIEKQRRELLGSRLLGVYGVLEREGEVVHLVAQRLIDYSALLGQLEITSRDFH
jgi:error-prone DNA polymerase